ncbi:MAG: hypothetical protein LBJ01_11370 [Tannerella sp.]|jgi:hypothetical protein|nr:hypothetical protein [Tannerella sp.]
MTKPGHDTQKERNQRMQISENPMASRRNIHTFGAEYTENMDFMFQKIITE